MHRNHKNAQFLNRAAFKRATLKTMLILFSKIGSPICKCTICDYSCLQKRCLEIAHWTCSWKPVKNQSFYLYVVNWGIKKWFLNSRCAIHLSHSSLKCRFATIVAQIKAHINLFHNNQDHWNAQCGSMHVENVYWK